VLRVELTTQLLRIRTLVALACLAAVPVLAAVATAPDAGHRNGGEHGLFGASPYSALNHAMASLAFIAPLLLPVVVSLLGAAIGSADRDWGVLRYLYVAPVSRSRLVVGKFLAAAVATTVAVVCVLVAGLISGLAFFGSHPFHVLGAPDLGAADAALRILAAVAYTLLCMLGVAAVALALGVLLPRGAEALGCAVAFVVVASMINAQSPLHAVAVVLPVHYWQDWTALFDPHATAHLGGGVVAQLATVLVAAGVTALVLRRRDPAA
jgi:ABC-2 type transport system permease protein